MADLPAAIVAFLKADAGTTGLAGTRIFGGELPPGETASMPRHAIVVAPSGGASLTGGSYAQHDTQRFDLFAYGATQAEAEQLRDVAALALRRLRRSVWAGVLLHWAQPAGGATSGRDTLAAWPRAFQSFQIFHGLVAVA